jgi:hypothetical protein
VRTKGRRRFDATLIVGGSLVAGGLTAFGAAVYNEERIERMWVGASYDADGTAALHEVIDYQFGISSDRHGLRRIIPGLSPSDAFVASSPDAPDGINSIVPTTIGGESGVDIKIGDATQTVTGRHRYVLDYRLGTIGDADGIAWDAVGTGWEVEVEQAEVEIVAPFELTNPRCFIGRAGSTSTCAVDEPEPGHLHVEVSGIDSGKGVTIEAGRGAALAAAPALPAAPAAPPADQGAGVAEPAAVAALAALGGGLVTSRLVRRAGRERVGIGAGGAADVAFAAGGGSEQLVDATELADLATTEFAPPEGISAAMGGVILEESVQAHHKVAWLIEAAVEGAVDLREEDGKTVRIDRTAPGDADTKAILDRAFGSRTSIELGSYDKTFAAGWAELGTMLETWSKGSALWDPAGDRRRFVARLLGVLLGSLSMAGAAVSSALASRYGEGWLAGVALGALGAGMGWAALIRGWELRVRTPLGSGQWLRVESFRRFLHESEAYHAEQAAQRGVLREYTAWAVAVGEIDRWKHAVQSSTVIPQSAGLSYVMLAPMLASSTSHASTAPSSSGGGGGGSVGGGGGGGGGGSW